MTRGLKAAIKAAGGLRSLARLLGMFAFDRMTFDAALDRIAKPTALTKNLIAVPRPSSASYCRRSPRLLSVG